MTAKVEKLRKLIDRRRREFGSVRSLSIASGFPFRTLQDWLYSRRTPNEYSINEIIHRLETFKKPTTKK